MMFPPLVSFLKDTPTGKWIQTCGGHSLIPALTQDLIRAEMEMKKAAGCCDSSISAA
jgi:hypothetical protein